MALSAAEKQRKYRQNRDLDAVKRAEYLRKEKERNKKRTKRNTSELTRREHKAQKSKWRELKREQRRKIKDVSQVLTPPMSPNEEPLPHVPGPSRQWRVARRQRNRQETEAKKNYIKVQKKLEIERRRAEMYKKRYERAQKLKRNEHTHDGQLDETPKRRTRKVLRNASKKTVRRTLLFHHVLLDVLKTNYRSSGRKGKKSLAFLLASKLLKKYRLRTHALAVLNFHSKTLSSSLYRTSLTRRLSQKVHSFYERDDNSRMTSGKKQTVTFRKIKKQKRLLCDSVKNLHQKFLAENSSTNISYASFWRLKPFWIRKPTEHERDTCLCKQHENFQFVVEKLHSLQVLEDAGLENVIKMTTCNANSKQCMFRECSQCKDFSFNLSGIDQNQEVTWFQWTYVREMRDIKNGERKEVSFTRKHEESGRLSDLLQMFYEQLPKFKRHYFTIKQQYCHYRNIQRTLTDKECMIHVDFAENYIGKMDKEVQSMHYGASKNQITLHTGMLYTRHSHKSFCSVTDSLEHGPAAVWAHLWPLLEDIRKELPDVEILNVYSDGPTSQYRQKGNFFLLSMLPFDLGFTSLRWNFFEAGHGKGAPDGVGGALKRRADELVHCGNSIMDASSFVSILNGGGTEVKLYLIDRKDISRFEKIQKFSNLQPIPGTMRIHQLICPSAGTLYYRDVSCTCRPSTPCRDHQCNKFIFPMKRRVRPVFRHDPLEESSVSTKKRRKDAVEKIHTEPAENRKTYFAKILKELSSCRTYGSISKNL